MSLATGAMYYRLQPFVPYNGGSTTLTKAELSTIFMHFSSYLCRTSPNYKLKGVVIHKRTPVTSLIVSSHVFR